MIFTSEQVSCGHPDKICNQISDVILTDCLLHDRYSRVAAECLIKDYEVIVAGEITSTHEPGYIEIMRGVLERIGLPNIEKYRVTVLVSQQSADIAQGVNVNGAGDQGMMFGYATNETPELMVFVRNWNSASFDRACVHAFIDGNATIGQLSKVA